MQELGVYGEVRPKASTQVSCPQPVSLLYANEQGSSTVSLSPSVGPRGSSEHAVCSWASALFSTGAPLCPPCCNPVMTSTSKLQTFRSAACKNLLLSAPLIFSVNGFGEVFFLMQCPVPCSLSLFLSLIKAHSPLQHWQFFSPPKSRLHTSYLPQRGLFSPPSCAVCSLNP